MVGVVETRRRQRIDWSSLGERGLFWAHAACGSRNVAGQSRHRAAAGERESPEQQQHRPSQRAEQLALGGCGAAQAVRLAQLNRLPRIPCLFGGTAASDLWGHLQILKSLGTAP